MRGAIRKCALSRSDKYTYLRKKFVSIWLRATFCIVMGGWAALKVLDESTWVICRDETLNFSHVYSVMATMEVNNGCVAMI